MAQRKFRIDELLVRRGLAPDLRTAQAWIMDRRIVSAGRVFDKPGERVGEAAVVSVRGVVLRYASKGGYKLESALSTFAIDVSGLSVLDAGASTGGFTDCLLERGARIVYAVDVGYGQLRGRLAADARVRVMERKNISDLKVSDFDPPIQLATIDLSYLSLRIAIPVVAGCFLDRPRIVALIKPLYEGLPQDRPNDQGAMRSVLLRLFQDLSGGQLPVHDVRVSPILGGRGAVEFLAYAEERRPAPSPEELTEKAMAAWAREPPSAAEELSTA
jgi:23S rRNA (cytidine1920-2'-O)/16S rRNA (cytidine1409-2'-O)-methyltransferase